MSGSPLPASNPNLTLRAVLFLLWLAIGNDWLTRHMGLKWDKPIFVGILAGLGAGFGALEAATGNDLKKYWIGRATDRALGAPLLTAMYAVLLIAVAGWSSVTVLNDPPNTVFDATLARADQVGGEPVHEDNAAEPTQPVQFAGIWVGVLGRPYRLLVKGYLPQMLNVYPIAGVSISPRKDLRVTPSILLRPPLEALGAMAGGVSFELTIEGASAPETVASGTVKEQSILVGTDQPIPQPWLESWRLELVAHRITNDSLLAQLLEYWKKPALVAPQKPLEPGRVVRAVVYNATHDAIAEARARLTDERFQDIAMNPVAREAPASKPRRVSR